MKRMISFFLTVLILIGVLGAVTSVHAEPKAYPRYKVVVDSGYLALRSEPKWGSAYEIGQLFTGDYVLVKDPYSDPTYWNVYSDKYATYGWVNKDYLQQADIIVSSSKTTGTQYTVSVKTGYLALRTAPEYSDANIIAKLYNGDKVEVLEKSGQYWWVYAPSADAKGYVNKDNLVLSSSSTTKSYSTYSDYKVSVASGYLALRSAPSYDTKNEIGELYTGDIVTVKDTSNSQYWWVYSDKYKTHGYVNKDYLIKK